MKSQNAGRRRGAANERREPAGASRTPARGKAPVMPEAAVAPRRSRLRRPLRPPHIPPGPWRGGAGPVLKAPRANMAARWLWLLALWARPAAASPPPDAEVTFVLPAGRRECFYQGAPGNASMEVEYQVIGGAGLDVDFSLESPSGRLLVSEHRRSDGAHTVEPTEAGDYRLCFDNSFSTISEKLVFFELLFDSPRPEEEEEEEEEEDEGNGWATAPEDALDVKIEDIK
ncbi:transmembrane emp24 domain-containing protein 1-like, partial [Numenius arquata]|uniref:transmembrane emp24 domain-containing protein 1-like n=1 Tax=Numenius arquata TaxID=31919 RepID=UPI003D30C71F